MQVSDSSPLLYVRLDELPSWIFYSPSTTSRYPYRTVGWYTFLILVIESNEDQKHLNSEKRREISVHQIHESSGEEVVSILPRIKWRLWIAALLLQKIFKFSNTYRSNLTLVQVQVKTFRFLKEARPLLLLDKVLQKLLRWWDLFFLSIEPPFYDTSGRSFSVFFLCIINSPAILTFRR